MTITNLCTQVYLNRLSEVKRIIETENISLNCVNPENDLRPIDIAIVTGNIEMLNTLISLGAKLNRSHEQIK